MTTSKAFPVRQGEAPCRPRAALRHLWGSSAAISAILLLATGGIALAASSPLTVAVYDFVDSTNNKAGIGAKITALVTADLAGETNLVVVERVQLGKALNEQAFGVSGIVSSDAAATIGQMTGAKVLVAGHAIRTEGSHLVIMATIIGTETGRLFSARVEGPANDLMQLTANLGLNISQTINAQAANLVAAAEESKADRFARIIKSIHGTNRPAVSVSILLASDRSSHCAAAETEFGALLLKAGFPVVEDNSEGKPELEITGVEFVHRGPRRGALFSSRAGIDLKVQERRTGNIVARDHQESDATDVARISANHSAQAEAVDALAQRILPLLAQ